MRRPPSLVPGDSGRGFEAVFRVLVIVFSTTYWAASSVIVAFFASCVGFGVLAYAVASFYFSSLRLAPGLIAVAEVSHCEC